jgi:hypothetical protein
VQWRQRFSLEMLTTWFAPGSNWKQAIVTTGDQPGVLYASCEAIGIVTTNYGGGFPILYNSCTGSTSHGPYDGLYQPIEGGDYLLQNARPDPYCLYSAGHTDPPSYFPPAGNCFGYFAEEWMTFQLGVEIGPRVGDEFVGSRILLWMAREGAPAELVIDFAPYNLTAGLEADDERYGKIWLLPYNTNKDPTVANPVAYTWYDELIVSRSRIADPA